MWRNSLNDAGNLQADGDGDETIDEDDYGVWKTNYGNVYSLGGGGLSTVPEPAGILMLTLGAIAMIGGRRR